MAESKSLLARFFGGIWSTVVWAYRLVVILSLVLMVGLVWVALREAKPAAVEDNVALVIYPTGSLVDTQDADPSQQVMERLARDVPSQTLLRDLIEALDRATDDSRIPLAVLRLDAMVGAGVPQMEELAVAVKKFQASGKPVYAYGPWYGQGDYRLVSEADHISLDPLGMVFIEGYSVYQNYFLDALEKLGAKVNVFRVGEFKSAVEPFERNDMSTEARLANSEWLEDLWRSYGTGVAAARTLPDMAVPEYVRALPEALQAAGGDAALVAQQAQLVDAVETLTAFRERIAQTVGWSDDHGSFRQVHYSDYLTSLRSNRPRPSDNATDKVALIVVQGEIVDGESEPGVAGGDTIADLLAEARKDQNAKAVVLRIDSPGGSVWASEQIRRELRLIKAEGKPVVVSMGNVAASGGYWIAMDADQIWAHATTITGSIGIFGLWPTFEGSLDKLGIHTDGLGTTALAGAFRGDRPLSPEARAVIQTQLDLGYRTFVEGVADGRGLPLPEVQQLARGRVWSGEDALDLGLVDGLGGLAEATAAAAQLANLTQDKFRLEEIRPSFNFRIWQLFELMGQSQNATAALVPAPLRSLTRNLQDSLGWLNDPRGQYAHCFCRPDAGAARLGLP